MVEKNTLKYHSAAIAILLVLISVFGILAITINLYIAILVTIFLVIGLSYVMKNISMDTKKKINENIFIIITGSAALVLILFVIYILSDIFWQSKGSLTLDFLLKSPEEGMTEGGIYPAIIGTAMLVIIMAVVGVPFGTLTAIYLSEYAKETSKIAKFIRFAINTLAGVPAIVFGLFGLGFFIGTIGNTIDNIEHNSRIEKLEVLLTNPNELFADDEVKLKSLIQYFKKDDEKYWTPQINILKSFITDSEDTDFKMNKNDILDKFKLRKNPSWGQPALIWAALTMALLTLPVVIVSVEEALRAVPKDLREASLALGATKFETIIKIVLPSSITGILTGTILAVSRGAGEVAPILFTGAAYFLPELPKALNSQFMELGYHIYILTTQSTNVEQTLPLQYATTFVLLILTFTLNFSAIFIRSKMRKRLNLSR